MQLTVAFDALLPAARWGPLFHVLCLERPEIRLAWRAVGSPAVGRAALDGIDAGLFVGPAPPEPGLDTLTIETSPMAVTTAVGHRLARREELAIADILDEPLLGVPGLDPRGLAFWTLDGRRGGPPTPAAGEAESPDAAMERVASGGAIMTVPSWMAGGLHHPGVITVPLRDGPPVATRLVWRYADESPAVRALVDLAAAWSLMRREGDEPGLAD